MLLLNVQEWIEELVEFASWPDVSVLKEYKYS